MKEQNRTKAQLIQELTNLHQRINKLKKSETQRKKTEEALRKSEVFNFALFQHSPVETTIVDREGKVVKTNLAKRNSRDRLPNVGNVMYKDYAPKHEIDMFADLMKCIRSGKKKRFPELKYGDKFLDITIAPFPKGAIITSQNITERKIVEKALRESEEKYRNLIENSQDSIAIIDLKGNVLFANKQVENLTGYTLEEGIGMNVRKITPIKYWKRNASLIRRAVNSEQIPYFESVIKRKDGKLVPVESGGQAIFQEGKAVAIQIITRDITERKQAEEALKESEKRFRELWDNAPVAYHILNTKGIITSVNKTEAKMIGYKPEEMIGKSIFEFILPEQRADARRRFQQKISGKYVPRTDNRIYVKKDGSQIYVEIDDVLERNSKGKFIGIRTTMVDITERKQAEEEIKNSREELRNLAAHLQSAREEERTLIAREIHDELGQALTALKMDLSLLTSKLPKYQKPLLSRAKSMTSLLDETIQTVKKLYTELRPSMLDDLGLAAVIEWQTEEFQSRTGIKCEVKIEPKEPILDKESSTAIFRIFQEALTNVARHTDASEIKVNLTEKAKTLELRVRDNGGGIAEDKIHDPQSYGLIGIRERVRFLGGEAKIKGVQNRGTTIAVSIPLHKNGGSQ
ncbi:MAG: PAS domain S-box protein [Candidatus Aminicenantes bacterium]|nr:PAS domain S-box protein [Candidatus Aminicenantes bacterium]MBL7084367.1 PAS domain S-box protein [Candidatus Aminicenantes bacterium]